MRRFEVTNGDEQTEIVFGQLLERECDSDGGPGSPGELLLEFHRRFHGKNNYFSDVPLAVSEPLDGGGVCRALEEWGAETGADWWNPDTELYRASTLFDEALSDYFCSEVDPESCLKLSLEITKANVEVKKKLAMTKERDRTINRPSSNVWSTFRKMQELAQQTR